MDQLHTATETERSSRRAFLTKCARNSAGLVIAPALLLGSTGSEAFAGGLFPKPSTDDQKKIGKQGADQILKQYREVHDDRADAFRTMGERLVSALSPDDRKWDFQFHVLDSKTINAFALPGGPMFMFTGLYDLLSTLDAMAAVTGHEMTHVRMEHWAKAYQKQQSRNFLLSLGLALSHASQGVQNIAGAIDNSISMKFSRGEEDQADQGGLENMVAAGFNPQGMIQLFQALEKASGNGGGLGGAFFSDHPLTSDRIKHTEQRIADLRGRAFPALTPLIGSKAA